MEWTLYWILKLDDIRSYLSFSFMFDFIPGIVIIVLTIVVVIAYCTRNSHREKEKQWAENALSHKKGIIRVYVLCFFLITSTAIIQVLLPSTKQLLSIVTVGYTMEQIKSNPKILNTADKVYQLVDSKLTELLQDVEVVKEKVEESTDTKEADK